VMTSFDDERKTIQPVVKPGEQPVGQRLNVCLHDACRLFNRFDNRLYRLTLVVKRRHHVANIMGQKVRMLDSVDFRHRLTAVRNPLLANLSNQRW